MFTGIVQGTAKVVKIAKKQDFRTHIIELPKEAIADLKVGASIAHNGCCLTVTAIDNCLVSFDLMQETLKVTNLGLLNENDKVNYERAARFGDEIGGHSMSGHISLMSTIERKVMTDNNCTLWFSLPKDVIKYVVKKGYIGIDGCSLTIGDVTDSAFCVHLIPETLNRTLFGQRAVGDSVNIEFDPQTQVIVDTVERVLAATQ